MRHFTAVYEGSRFAEGIVIHRPAMARVIAQRAEFFALFGLTPSAYPMEVMMAIEYAAQSPRWRGQCYLFGFPGYAVDFYVTAGEAQERTGKMVERDIYSAPTFIADEHHFVWAVPKGHEENDEDRAIKMRAVKILESYKRRRAKYIGEGKPGDTKLQRDWFDDGKGSCSLSNAR